MEGAESPPGGGAAPPPPAPPKGPAGFFFKTPGGAKYVTPPKDGVISGSSKSGTKSDRRLKNVGEKYVAGLDELKKLDFFHYTFKKDETKTPHVGVMAQDLQKVFPDAVIKGEDGYLRIRTEDMFYAVINAVKELDSKISDLVEKVNSLVEDITTMKSTIEAQQKTINKHELKAIIELEKPTKEEKLRMIIRHLLNSCISNLWWLEKKSEAVNSESVNDIYRVINQLYENKDVLKIVGIDKKNLQECTDYAKAFIKVITRPFFTDHIRQKQASMRFCLEKLNMALFESEESAKTIVENINKHSSEMMVLDKK